MGTGGFRRALLLGGSAIGVLAGLNAAFAQQSETELAPVVVQGGAKKTDDSQPVQDKTTTKVKKAVLDQRMADSFEDVGRRVDAGVNFSEANKSVNLRGLQNDRVLTTIDGIRMPWLTDPRSNVGGPNNFDFGALSEMDIVRGADSSRYGEGALGGVVQLRTLNPEDLIEDGKSFGGLIKGAYDSADRSWKTNAAIAGRVNDTWLMVQGGYGQGHETENFGTVGGYGATRTEPNPRDYDQKNLLVKLRQYVDGGHRFGLTGELFERDDEIHNMIGTTAAYVPGAFMSGDISKRRRISADYSFVSPDGTDVLDKANLTLYWQSQLANGTTDAIRQATGPGSGSWPFVPTGAYTRDNKLKQSSYGLFGDAEKQLDIGGYSHLIRFGGEVRSDHITQYSAGVDNCPTTPIPFSTCAFLDTNHSDMPDVDSTVIGFFAEDDIKLMDDRLTLTPGVRVDWYSHRPKSTLEFERSLNYDPAYLVGNSKAGVSPKLRAAWQASPELEVFAQWAQGFRAPSAAELYQNYANYGLYARIGNPDLKPETSNGFEIGASYDAGDYAVSANVFNNYYRNFIDTVNLGTGGGEFPFGITGYENLDKAHIYGAEVRGRVNFMENWKAWGSLAVARGTGERDGVKKNLNSVAPLRAILGLGYETETWGVDASATLVARDSKINKSTGTTPFYTPGYGIVDLTAWWSPEQVKGLKVQAGVYNLFDKKYWKSLDVTETAINGDANLYRMDRYTEPGRTFRVAVTQKF